MTDKTTPVVEQQRRWLKIAKSAGDHGVRYRTNYALEAFMREVGDEFRDHMQPAKADALLDAGKRLIAVFDQQRMTTAERIIAGISDAGLRTEGNAAIEALRAALRSTPEQPSGEPVPELDIEATADNIARHLSKIGDTGRYHALAFGPAKEAARLGIIAGLATPQSPTPASPSLDEVERVEIDRPFMLAAARAWWAVHMGGNVRAINITGDGRVKVAWSDADESGHYTLPVDFLAALSAPASATSERIEVREIETVTGDFYTEPGEPFWRIEIGGYCADFPSEQAARNFAAALSRLDRHPGDAEPFDLRHSPQYHPGDLA